MRLHSCDRRLACVHVVAVRWPSTLHCNTGCVRLLEYALPQRARMCACVPVCACVRHFCFCHRLVQVHKAKTRPEQMTPEVAEAIKFAVAFVKQKYTEAGLWAPFIHDLQEHRPSLVTALRLTA
jgi:hypothetical protein